MKKTVLVYGLIAGVIASLTMGITLLIGMENLGNAWGMVLGFTGMIIAFAFIFVAIVKYRDQINKGAISFGKALLIGLGISFIASTMYVLVWMVEYRYMYPDFMEKYTEKVIESKKDEMPEKDFEKFKAEMAETAVKYKNNAGYRAGITYSEILPLGILASVLAAAILRKKPKTQTSA